jgi:hypothetical protein
MDMVKGVLREQLEYAIYVQDEFEKSMEGFPKGSIVKKEGGYCYLAYREGGKVKFEYIGKLSDEELKIYQEKIEKRRRYKKLLRDNKEQIKFLRRALKVKGNESSGIS